MALDVVGMLRSFLSACQKRFHGLAMFGKIENPKGHRVETILTANGPLRTDTSYRAAFVTRQGVPTKYGRERVDLPVCAIDALRAYFQTGGTGLEKGNGRFIAV